MIDQPLKVLGLTDYEEKAYLSLATLGVCRASELAKESKIPRQKIYEILESLNEKGFVNIIQDKVTLYSPISPIFIEKLLTDKFESARNYLINLQGQATDNKKDKIFIVRGKSRVEAIIYQFSKSLEVEKSVHIIGNNLFMLSKVAKDLIKLKRKSVDIKIIASNDPQTEERAKIFRKNRIETRLISPKRLKGVQGGTLDDKAAVIFNEDFFIFSDSKFLVNFVQNYFDMMWSNR